MGRIKLEDSSEQLAIKKKTRDKLKRKIRPLMKAVSFKSLVTEDESDDCVKVDDSAEYTWNRKCLVVALLALASSIFLSTVSY